MVDFSFGLSHEGKEVLLTENTGVWYLWDDVELGLCGVVKPE